MRWSRRGALPTNLSSPLRGHIGSLCRSNSNSHNPSRRRDQRIHNNLYALRSLSKYSHYSRYNSLSSLYALHNYNSHSKHNSCSNHSKHSSSQ